MQLHILGCYAATPKATTNPTSQLLNLRNNLFLIDCGEGTQVQLRKLKIKFSRINHIFISHLHGDHFFGLPGLLATFRLLGREKELHVYGPQGIQEAITLLFKLGNSWANFPLLFHELTSDKPETIFEDNAVSVQTLPLNHRIYTNGFLFREKPRERKLNVEAMAKFKIGKAQFQNIKNGKDILLPDGRLLPNTLLTLDPPKPRSYAYCSDTAYMPELVSLIRDVDVLYHEATFLETESALAATTRHSTAKQAAAIARDAAIGTLILGHFSTRYRSIELFRQEAMEIFPHVSLADDGKIFEF